MARVRDLLEAERDGGSPKYGTIFITFHERDKNTSERLFVNVFSAKPGDAAAKRLLPELEVTACKTAEEVAAAIKKGIQS